MFIILSMFLCFLVVTPHCSKATKDIFILAGQSNMAGRGGVLNGKWDGNIPPECKPNPSILKLNTKLKWEEAHEPLHADIDVGKTCGIGPGLAFANEVVRMSGGECDVGLVPCAVGGTRIEEWRNGSHLYNELVRRSIESVKDGDGVIRAVLWYQGESDTVREEDAEEYKYRMENLIENLRLDLQLPSLLVIQVSFFLLLMLLFLFLSFFCWYNVFFVFLMHAFAHLEYQILKMNIFLCICKYCSSVILNYYCLCFLVHWIFCVPSYLHRKVENLKRGQGKGGHIYSNFKFQTSVMNVNDRTCDVF